ncbi:MAG: hypothetical protein LC620_02340 [Halobacteriales archaeon]|nr:hypothetical protein [Halobacteriales archaeon]
MQSRKPAPQPTAAVKTDTIVDAAKALRVATADQIGEWVRKREVKLPKATLYRLLAKAVTARQLNFLEMDGRRLYYDSPTIALAVEERQAPIAISLPRKLQEELDRFVTKQGAREKSFVVVVRAPG